MGSQQAIQWASRAVVLVTILFGSVGQAADLKPGVAKTVESVRAELGDKFRITVVQDWFVVASNGVKSTHKNGESLVERTYKAMYNEYFEVRPDKPVKILLFTNARTYEDYCVETYGWRPETPYGFYREEDRQMVMNIATGGGTLNHELIHAIIRHDFPEVPSWFNESFASLFEGAYYTRDGKMRGMVNWRLPGLHQALRAGDETSLRDLMETSTDEFYGDDSGHHYAMGRYLMYYLQEKGLLRDYYRAYRDGFKADSTGIKTLEKITGKDIDALNVEWRKYALRLKYER